MAQEAEVGIVCDDCGCFIREGPSQPDPVFEGRTGYIHSLCKTCLPHHECPEFDEHRRQAAEEARRWLADQRRKKEHPGQAGMFEALDENR